MSNFARTTSSLRMNTQPRSARKMHLRDRLVCYSPTQLRLAYPPTHHAACPHIHPACPPAHSTHPHSQPVSHLRASSSFALGLSGRPSNSAISTEGRSFDVSADMILPSSLRTVLRAVAAVAAVRRLLEKVRVRMESCYKAAWGCVVAQVRGRVSAWQGKCVVG